MSVCGRVRCAWLLYAAMVLWKGVKYLANQHAPGWKSYGAMTNQHTPSGKRQRARTNQCTPDWYFCMLWNRLPSKVNTATITRTALEMCGHVNSVDAFHIVMCACLWILSICVYILYEYEVDAFHCVLVSGWEFLHACEYKSKVWLVISPYEVLISSSAMVEFSYRRFCPSLVVTGPPKERGDFIETFQHIQGIHMTQSLSSISNSHNSPP